MVKEAAALGGRCLPTTDALRVGVDVTWLPRDRRGMGRFVLQTLTEMLQRDDVALTLASRDRADRAALELLLDHADRWRFTRWNEWPRRQLDVCWFPWNRVDVLPPAPRVVTIHDTAAFDWPKTGGWAWLDNRRAQGQLRRAVARAQRVMTVSLFSRDCIVKHLGVADADVVVEGESFARLADTVKVNPRPRPYVLYVGAEDPRKNLDGLLGAWQHLGRTDFELVVVGATRDQTDGVSFIGEADDVTLAGLYRYADLFVMPSLYEGFGLPLLEAMACGAPVAAARAASLPEVGGDVPDWFDPHDIDQMAAVIGRLLDDPQGRARKIEAGLARAREFTWARCAEQVVDVLRKAAAR